MDILIVDDMLNWRTTLNDVLDDYTTKVAETYSEAHNALLTTKFKLAILDTRLVDADPNNIDGFRLLEEIEKLNLETKVIIITGYVAQELLAEAEKSEKMIAVFRKKDFELDLFIATVDKVMSQSR